MQGSISLRMGAQTHFMGWAEPWIGRAATWSKDQSGGFSDMQWTEADPALTSPTWGAGTRGHKGVLARTWGSVEDKQQVQRIDRREHITFNHINGCHLQKLSLLRAPASLMEWVVQTQSNPRSAWKRQYSRVRACDQRDNAGRHWCERVLLAAETPTVKICIIFCVRWDLISIRMKLIEHLVNHRGN